MVVPTGSKFIRRCLYTFVAQPCQIIEQLHFKPMWADSGDSCRKLHVIKRIDYLHDIGSYIIVNQPGVIVKYFMTDSSVNLSSSLIVHFVFLWITYHLYSFYNLLVNWIVTLKASKSRRHRQVKLDSSDCDSASGQGQVKATRKKEKKERLKPAGRKMSFRNKGNFLKSY